MGRRGWQHAALAQPGFDEHGPSVDGVSAVPCAKGVAALREEVDLRWDPRGVQRTCINDAVADRVDLGRSRPATGKSGVSAV